MSRQETIVGSSTRPAQIDVERAVGERYSAAASAAEPTLCCAVPYNQDYLKIVPEEIIERDYGCGDPTPYVRPGDTVLDLGSGGGKVCYIAAQIVGPEGRIIGVDCNKEMLSLARRYRATVAERLGFANVDFRCGMIQDLRLDLDKLSEELACHPVCNQQDWMRFRAVEERLRDEQPLVRDSSIDCVVSNCVLNLVRPDDRRQLFSEVCRVLKRGGRAVICDIVSDEDVPKHLQKDPQLWSGCISGAYREDLLLKAFEEAGFHGIRISKRQEEPWRTVEGIEFRSLTIQAFKGKQGPCLERSQALAYRGPFKKVEDDDGHVFYRGERTAVCDKTFHLLQREPYTGMFEPIDPREEIPLDRAAEFDCRRSARRHPHESKGLDYDLTTEAQEPCCGPDESCC